MGHKLVSCTSSPILMHSLRETFSLYVSLTLYLNLSGIQRETLRPQNGTS
uniref:Uncharacterized protein n=1 Tax=Brassica oleracea TaxID=3712 RepID=A0A3P6D2A0_BRAOL|nr:unnamed protein product [Brassica oleracea]